MATTLLMLFTLVATLLAPSSAYVGLSCAGRSYFHGGLCFETHANIPFQEAVAHLGDYCVLAWGKSCADRGFPKQQKNWITTKGLPLKQAVPIDILTAGVEAFALPYDCTEPDCVAAHGGPKVDLNGYPLGTELTPVMLAQVSEDNKCTTSALGCAWAGLLALDVGFACKCDVAVQAGYKAGYLLHGLVPKPKAAAATTTETMMASAPTQNVETQAAAAKTTTTTTTTEETDSYGLVVMAAAGIGILLVPAMIVIVLFILRKRAQRNADFRYQAFIDDDETWAGDSAVV